MRERNAPSQRNHIHTYSNIYAINLTSCIAFVTVARLHSYSNIVPLSSLMVLGCCCFTYVLCLCCTTTFSCLSRLDYTLMDLYRIYNNTRKKNRVNATSGLCAQMQENNKEWRHKTKNNRKSMSKHSRMLPIHKYTAQIPTLLCCEPQSQVEYNQLQRDATFRDRHRPRTECLRYKRESYSWLLYCYLLHTLVGKVGKVQEAYTRRCVVCMCVCWEWYPMCLWVQVSWIKYVARRSMGLPKA